MVDLPSEGSPSTPPSEGRSVVELLSLVSQNISTLLQQEIALAKAELRESGTRAGLGVGLFIGAALGGLFVLIFLSISGWWALGLVIGNQWSALVVAGVWALIAAVLALVGKKEFQRIRGIKRTTETLSRVPDAVTGHEQDAR